MLRKIAAVAAGLFVVMGVVGGLQLIGAVLYPLPEGIDLMDPAYREALEAHARAAPAWVMALAFASEIVGGFLGALVAGAIVRERKSWFAGAIILLALVGSVFNWTAFRHPAWFIAGQLVAYPAAFLLARRLLTGGEWGARQAAPPAM